MIRSHAAGKAMASVLLLHCLFIPGCVLTPDGTTEERQRAAAQGRDLEPRMESRTLPDLPEEPTWRHVLSRAFLADGELEAAYFRWKAALERIDIAGTWPNSNVTLRFETMFSESGMSAFDRTTFMAGFDGMETLAFPTKTAQAAKVALDEARAAGEKFRAVKFDVQRRVLFAWADYVQHAREIGVKQEELTLRRMLVEVGGIRAAGGAGQGGLVRADVDLRLAENELDELQAEHAAMRAMLNAWMHRDPAAPLPVPNVPEAPRRIPSSDAEMVALAAETFPEVAMFAREVEGRQDALELARMRWIPDISPTASFTGSVAQALGAMIMLPTTVTRIRAGVREMEAELRAAEAVLRQRRVERVGEYVGLLVTLRRGQERARLLRDTIEPAAARLVEAEQRAYEGGSAELRDVLESRELQLSIQVLIARTDALIERAVVDIECCLGIDIESLTKEPGHG